MNSSFVRRLAALPVAGLLLVQPAVSGSLAPLTAHAFSYASLNVIQKRILSGFADFELNPANAEDTSSGPDNYSPRPNSAGCPVNLSSNIKVNQGCLNLTDRNLQGRAQANNETAIAQNPMDPNDLVATSNNYLRGDGNCIADFSVDGGRNWTDSMIPMQFTRGRPSFGAFGRQYWGAGGDPSVAWDTKGNAYFSCQVFGRGRPVSSSPDLSSAVYVFRSTGNFGASWNFPGRAAIESADVLGTGLPAFEDKPYLTVDNHVGSPFQDRIYVAYTEFTVNGAAIIYESFSNDFGEHFSARQVVSLSSPFCTVDFGVPTNVTTCNENQFADPFTGPDGALYIAFQNFNNPVKGQDNRNQVLIVKSTDGGMTFSPPVKVADFYDLPDCPTYQQGKDFGRACVPEKAATANSFFRATNYPSAGVNPTNPAQVVVTFGSYINRNSNESNGCVPTGINLATGNNLYTGVKTPGACNNDILLSVSNDAAATFTGATIDPRDLPTVTTDSGQATTDQWWQWAAFTKSGKLAVSYYDRQYGDDETTGFSDVSLSGSGDLTNFVVSRVTSGSNPPPTQFNGTFLGDYSGLTAITDAYPLWSDTRDPDLFLCPNTATPTAPPALCAGSGTNGAPIANDQDIFTAKLAVPSK